MVELDHDTPSVDAQRSLSLLRRQRELEREQRRIRSCVACIAAGYIPSAMPIFKGHAGQRIMIVGQAPAYRKVETPPYSGASGRALGSWLARAGFPIPPEPLGERFYLTSLTKCFPGPARSGQGDRPPSSAEIALCWPHLDRELDLVQPEVIITLGRLAATRFVGRQPLSDLVGKVFQSRVAVVVPLPHPSGVSRWLNDPANQRLLEEGLAQLAVLRVERGL
jgi:uracil-DNA glycosylase family 4